MKDKTKILDLYLRFMYRPADPGLRSPGGASAPAFVSWPRGERKKLVKEKDKI